MIKLDEEFRIFLRKLFNLDSRASISEGAEKFGKDGFLSFRQKLILDNKIHVFLKSSDSQRKELEYLGEFGKYFSRTECFFYGFLIPILEPACLHYSLLQVAPKCFYHRIADSGTMIVMEDLNQQGFSVANQRMSLLEVTSVITSLAHIQAAYWITRQSFNYLLDDGLLCNGSKFETLMADSKINYASLVEISWKTFNQKIRNYANEEDAQLLLKYFSKRDRLIQRFYYRKSKPSMTGIVHGDLWFTNIFLKGLDCRIFDWQLWKVGDMLFDFGQLILSSTDEDIISNHFTELVDVYFNNFKNLFESATGKNVQASREDFQLHAVDALNNGMYWVLAACDLLWRPESNFDVQQFVKNAITALKVFKLEA